MTRAAFRFGAVTLSAALVLSFPAARHVEAAAGCTVSSVSPIAFGLYDVFKATPTDGAGAIRYQCSGNPTVMISLSGMIAGPTREMSSGSERLNYNVYTDAARTTLFGDDTFGASSLLVGQIKNSGQQTTNFYGRVPAGQDVAAGAFSATLVVTLNF